MAVVAQLVALTDVRDVVAATLDPVDAGDPDVLVDVVDSLYPPVLMILPAQPYVTPAIAGGTRVMGPCTLTAHVRVRCVASRVDPAPGFRKLDELVAHVVRRMREQTAWTLGVASGALAVEMARITYLASDVTYDIPVTV